MHADSVVWCNQTVPSIRMVVQLVRNGDEADVKTHVCQPARECHLTATGVNQKGNQRWCTRVEGGVSWAHVPTRIACENRGFCGRAGCLLLPARPDLIML